MIRIACQTIVYGNPVIKTEIDRILQNVSANGYQGVEVGARHFYMDRPAYYQELLAQYNLTMAAVHVGGDFLNRDSVDDQIKSIDQTVAFAKQLGCNLIYLSGVYRDHKTQEDYLHEAKVYSEIGRHCNDNGMTLCYHNHDWEIQNGQYGMKLLLDNVDPALMKLVPDVGWVTVGGTDPVAFLRENIDRVQALHFKDFKDMSANRVFTELGTGIVPFGDVYAFIRDKLPDLWISAEQDQATHTPEESSAANYRYIAGLVHGA